ncbi:kelch-like protein 10 [Larus michahellis]|uniref:kelch-like protein 10 n=1 Tax=Larus michahellis TaxID=119627 RepID=UPI003D9B4BD9
MGHVPEPPDRERKMSAVACTAFHGLCPEGKLGDGIISVDGIEFIAHKMILSSCSPYFRALFSSSWSNAERKVYQIPGTSSQMMRLLMEYAYTGTVLLTDDNVESLLIVADQFNVLDIVRLCCEFLKSQLCLENCIGIWRFTGYYYCPDLREAAHEFILHHFEEVTKVSTEFLALSFNELERLLEKDELPVKEEAVLEAVLKWVAHDLQSRRQHVVVLLGKEGWKTVNSTSARPPQPRLPPILMSPISSSFALVPFRSTAVGAAEVPRQDENL